MAQEAPRELNGPQQFVSHMAANGLNEFCYNIIKDKLFYKLLGFVRNLDIK